MIKSESYKIYYASNIKLARSIVLKSQVTIDRFLEMMKLKGTPESDNPLTWKYYMTLAGEYHFDHQPMYVKSFDDQTTILFDKLTLADHPLTVTEYQTGTKSREELEEKYPHQAQLIARILDPIDKEKAIAASDMEILYVDEGLIADNETNLVSEIQNWIDSVTRRWFISSMGMTDIYYPSTFLGGLFTQLPNIIASIRLENAHTERASQWHIWTYLGGFYNLNDFKEYLSLEQTLYLYRNIISIRNNAGKEDMLREIIKNLGNSSGVEAYQFDMLKQDAAFLDSKKVSLRFNQSRLLDDTINIDPGALKTPFDMMQITKYVADDNQNDLNSAALTLESGGAGSITSDMKTNILEFSQHVSDFSRYGSSVQLSIDYWIHLSSLGLYRGSVLIPIPGKPALNLTPLEALILFVYAGSASNGITLTTIPKLYLYHVIPESYRYDLAESFLDSNKVYKEEVMSVFRDNALGLERIDGLTELDSFIDRVASQNNAHFFATDYAKGETGKSMIINAALALTINREVRLATDGLTFENWLTQIEFDITELNTEDWSSIAKSCLQFAAGVSESSEGLPYTQQKVVEVIDRITSYGLISVGGRSYAANSELDWHFLGTDNYSSTEASYHYLEHDGGEVVGETFVNREIETSGELSVGDTNLDVRSNTERSNTLITGTKITAGSQKTDSGFVEGAVPSISNVSFIQYDSLGNPI